MAQYKHLMIYKTAYDAFFKIVTAVNHFPREYKYSLGERLQNASISIIEFIYKANSAKDKFDYIQQVIDNVQMVYLFLRLSMDLKIISTEKYAELVEMYDNVSRQAAGWQKGSV